MDTEWKILQAFFPASLKEEDLFDVRVTYRSTTPSSQKNEPKDRHLVVYEGFAYLFPPSDSEEWLKSEPDQVRLLEEVTAVHQKWRQVEVTCRHERIEAIQVSDEGLFRRRQMRRFLSHLQ